ncbi:TolB family protein [Gracilibacillus thailandensis]|uniref:TolB family protein n=1 Tax=Gracilibacillus thailandensis TaxID=563735 RepID=UPI00129C4D06|nr:DPP IV N-terminal domain-containing protein [Gracilibacillus thailandensis]
MRRKKLFLIIIGIVFLCFALALLYTIFSDNDNYKYFTGLGSTISIAPDDSQIAFSYYIDGEESIYTASPNGTDVRQITDDSNTRDHNPSYSSDGSKIVYMSENNNGIQTLQVINQDGSDKKQLTNRDMHVRDAIFSNDGETIFFIGIEAEEYNKGEQSREGFDLYSTQIDEGTISKLTDADHFSMDDLSLSPDGQTIYYSEFDGKGDRIYSYSLEKENITKQAPIIPKEIVEEQSFHSPQLSPDGEHLAFTDVANEAEGNSLFEYELFLLDLTAYDVEKLTSLENSIESPVFFHSEDKIAFLEYTNWAQDPAEYQLMTIDLTSHNIKKMELDLPASTNEKLLMRLIDQSINSFTLAILYMLLVGLLSVFCHYYYYPRKTYLPSIVSFSIAVLTFIASILVAMMMNAWYGIALGMLAAGIFGCSVVVVLFVFIFKRLVR